MSYRDFRFPRVCEDFGLDYDEQPLFPSVEPIELDFELKRTLDGGRLLSPDPENLKARSEFVTAPFLLWVYSLGGERFGLFSGTELSVDPERGLDGPCDFLLAQDPFMYILRDPLCAITQAPNDNVNNGFGPCIATMKAIDLYNSKRDKSIRPIYGASTTAVEWKFFKLDGNTLTLDRDNYGFADLPKVAGILLHIVQPK